MIQTDFLTDEVFQPIFKCLVVKEKKPPARRDLFAATVSMVISSKPSRNQSYKYWGMIRERVLE